MSAMTNGRVILWWELRRLPYNLLLLVVGLAALAGMEWLVGPVTQASSDAPQLETGLTIFVFGFMANICYTLGWIVELLGRRTDPESARRRARWMFQAGLLSSCFLTSLPFWFGLVYWFAHRGLAH
jgi:hypothetical protein